MCNCGCNTCETKKPVMLNESLAPKEILSEGLKYHMDNNMPLTEHVYRAGSQSYFNLWAEARALYSRGILEVTGDDLEVLTETDLGHYGMFEGKKVPLDFPIELNENRIIIKTNGNRLAIDKKDLQRLKSGKDIVGYSIKYPGQEEWVLAKDKWEIEGPLTEAEKLTYNDFVQMVRDDMMAGASPDEKPSEEQVKKKAKAYYNDYLQGASVDSLFEAKKKAKKNNKKLNKPMRDSSGGKAYKVYVKDPKTKKIKTVRFGSGGLRAKINDKKARNAFAARHKCSQKKDKTKAGYWSCRLPRYAKLLGLKSNFGGFW